MVPQWRAVTGVGSVDLNTQKLLDKDPDAATAPRTPEEVGAMVRALYGPQADWKLIDANLRISGSTSNALNEVDATVNSLRNASLIDFIATSLRQQRRIMVATGYTHLAALIEKLNKLESICPK